MSIATELVTDKRRFEPRRAVLAMPEYHPPLAGRDALRLDFNENTLAPSPKVIERLQAMTAEGLTKYPEREAVERIVAAHFGLQADQVLLTNGVDEAIHLVCAAFLEEDDEAMIARRRSLCMTSARDDDARTDEGAGGCVAGVSVRAIYGGDYAADEADYGGFAEQSDGRGGEPGASAGDRCGGSAGGGDGG